MVEIVTLPNALDRKHADMTSTNAKPLAFVIMPFGADFDGIYNSFLKTTVEDAGFQVNRADELSGSENRMNTIIRGLEECCVVIADLTDSNPNVYYELGLAHSMHKPVISLTQNLDELPFDIKTHGVIHYSRDFERMDVARKELSSSAAGVLTGATPFGNPFSDYQQITVEAACVHEIPTTRADGDAAGNIIDNDPPGILELNAVVEQGFQDLTESTERIGKRTRQSSTQMNYVSDKMAKIHSSEERPRDAARQQRALIQSLAQDMNGYARFLATENDNYAQIIDKTRPALEESLRQADVSTDEDRKALNDLLSTIQHVEAKTSEFRDSTEYAATAASEMPHVDRSLTRARNAVVEQMRRLTGNIEQLLSMLLRARLVLQLKES